MKIVIAMTSQRRWLLPVIILVVAAIGALAIFITHAATPATAVESENGTLASPARIINDTSASNGKAVQFGASSGSSSGGSSGGTTTVYGYRGTPGIPAGTSLKQISSGDYTVSTDNTVLDGVYIPGQLVINANNVTVENSHIDGPGGDNIPVINVAGDSATISHNLIGNSSNVLSGHFGVLVAGGGATKILGNDMIHTHGGVYLWADGVSAADSVLIQDNWVHEMTALAGDHMNNITSECSYNVTIDHNRLEGAVASGSQADTAFTLSVYSDDQTGCSVTISSPYKNTSGQNIGGLKNLTFTNNYGDGHGSYGLWVKDVIGTATFGNNMESDSGYGVWAAPDFISWDGFGNVNTDGSVYPVGAGNINVR